MQRREFMEMAAGAFAASALSGCAGKLTPPIDTKVIPTGSALTEAAVFDAARRFVDTSFGRIAYVDRGTGDATALFLHGFPLSGFQWRGAIDRLCAYRRCIAPDFMALGLTDIAEGQSVGPDAQVDMIVALLDRLSIATADVIASDSGGAVAQLLVARHTSRVRTLLLTNCDSEIDSPPLPLLPVIELSRAGRFVDEWLAPWLADKTLARSEKGIGGMCYADPSHPTDEALEHYFAPLVSFPLRKAQAHRYAVALETNALAGVSKVLKRCATPTRIVWGMADTIFSPVSPTYLDRTFGNSRGVRRLPGAKLFWPEELPDVVAEEAMHLWRTR